MIVNLGYKQTFRISNTYYFSAENYGYVNMPQYYVYTLPVLTFYSQ